MFIKCPNCGAKDNAEIKTDEKKVICKQCNSNIYSNFTENNGVVMHEEDLAEVKLPSNSWVILQNVSDNPQESMKILVNQELPAIPFDGAKKVKYYIIRGHVKIEAYYD